MSPTIAVAHYPEGAGHATRMLAIADALQEAGADVVMAGGGAGSRFVELNGYDAYEPTTVDYIDTYQDGSMTDVLTRSLPSSADRVTDYLAWLREVEPDAVVTDDMFAAFAASRVDVPLYALKHDLPALYEDPLERTGARFHTWFQLSVTREFFYPAIWPSDATDPPDATRIPPVALDDDGRVADDAPDVVLVPSHYSSFDETAAALEADGYDVLNVGDDDWEAVPSLLPYIRGADLVVCSGYSTIMDAAVAGTPCVVHPATDEQEAVADWLERFDVAGFTVAPDPIDVLDAVASPPESPSFPNGARFIARKVLLDLRDPDPYATPSPDPSPAADADIEADSRLRSLATVPTLAAVGLLTTTSAVAPSRIGRKLRTTVDRIAGGGERAGRYAFRSGRGLATAVRDGLSTAAAGSRGLLGRFRRVVPGRVGSSSATHD